MFSGNFISLLSKPEFCHFAQESDYKYSSQFAFVIISQADDCTQVTTIYLQELRIIWLLMEFLNPIVCCLTILNRSFQSKRHLYKENYSRLQNPPIKLHIPLFFATDEDLAVDFNCSTRFQRLHYLLLFGHKPGVSFGRVIFQSLPAEKLQRRLDSKLYDFCSVLRAGRAALRTHILLSY